MKGFLVTTCLLAVCFWCTVAASPFRVLSWSYSNPSEVSNCIVRVLTTTNPVYSIDALNSAASRVLSQFGRFPPGNFSFDLRNLCIAQDILPSVEEWQVYAALPATVTATSVPVQITGPFQMFIVSLNSTNSFVKLVWDRSPTADVFGYNVYYGTASRTYTKIVSAGSSTTFTAGPFVSGVTCYFAVTAYNLLGMESDFSNEVSYMIPKPFTSITLQL